MVTFRLWEATSTLTTLWLSRLPATVYDHCTTITLIKTIAVGEAFGKAFISTTLAKPDFISSFDTESP